MRPSQNTINNVKSRNPAYVLGFNEPERPDQANMTVAQAISSWTTISNSFTGTSTKLVSPAVSDTSDGQAWLSSFMSQATAANLKVDAVAFHWYGVSTPDNPAGAASSFLSRVDSYHNSYNKPVFITEFAIHDWGGNYTRRGDHRGQSPVSRTSSFPRSSPRSYVAGYAWYHWFNDAHLYDGNPPKPTEMGYSYVGAVGTGQTADIGGMNLGEHAAYLDRRSSSRRPAPRRARSATSTRWTTRARFPAHWTGGWAAVRRGSAFSRALRCAKAARIKSRSGPAASPTTDLLEVSQGTLRIGVNATGSGNVRVKGGTLALFGSGRLTTAPLDRRAVRRNARCHGDRTMRST